MCLTAVSVRHLCCIEQCILKCGAWTWSISNTGNVLKMQMGGTHPRPKLNQELCRWHQAVCDLKVPPGNSDVP